MNEELLFRIIIGGIGITFVSLFFGLLFKGIDRKIAAHMQKRVGPPIRQPFRDIG
jgi:formate hydrogenlyase subunit 4